MATHIRSKFLSGLLFSVAAFVLAGCNMDDNGIIQSNTQQEETTTQPSQPVVAPQEQDKTPISKVSASQRAEYLDLINAARAETQDCGSMGVFDPVPALTWNVRLDNAAYEHSKDMAYSNIFSHTGSGGATDTTAQNRALGRGSKFYERIEDQGYTHYLSVGENLAAGYLDPEDVIEGWLESDHHCANLMSPAYREVGMALVEDKDSDYGTYWSQEFGEK